MAEHLRAGVARADITPPIGAAHAGWGAQIHKRAVGADLPLWATALAIADEAQRVVIVDIDTTYLMEPEAIATRQAVAALTGLPESHIRLSYTHTHSGPIHHEQGSWIKGGADMITPYNDNLAQQVAGAAWSAMRAMRPVRVGAGRGNCRINVNRRYARPGDGVVVVGRNWDGPIDPEVQVVRFDALDGTPVAAIVNYACHPITVGPDNDLFTPDYPGVVKRVVEQATGATCLFLQGATGDIGPIRGVAKNGINEYKRLGAILGHEASRIWWAIELPAREEHYAGTLESGAPLAIYDDRPLPEPERALRVVARQVGLPQREIGDPATLAAAAQQHAANLERLRTEGASDAAIQAETFHAKRTSMRAGLAARLAAQDAWPVEMQGIALGSDVALLAMAIEPFSEIGLAIKAGSPFVHTLVSGYSNVGWAYLPTGDAYPRGGYEIEITPFAPTAADEAVTAGLAILNELTGS